MINFQRNDIISHVFTERAFVVTEIADDGVYVLRIEDLPKIQDPAVSTLFLSLEALSFFKRDDFKN